MHPRLYQRLLGATSLRAPNDDSGHVNPPADPPADPTPAPNNEPDDEPPVTPPGTPPTDSEAKLIKDVMKHKGAAQAAKAAKEAAEARVAAYGGVDPERVRQLVAAAEQAEREEAERRGEYDRVVASMREQQDAERTRLQAESSGKDEALRAAQNRIDELTIGRSFSDSKFLSEQTVLTGTKARKLFGEHFDIVDGEPVAYDKPKGAADRTPLVNANGEHLSFEAAIEKIVKADPDYDRLARASLRPGSGTAPIETTVTPTNGPNLRGRSLIANALGARSVRKAK